MQEYKQFLIAKIEEYKQYNKNNTIYTEPYNLDVFDNMMKVKQHNVPSILREYLTTVSSCFYINDSLIMIDINIFPDYNDIIKYKNIDNICDPQFKSASIPEELHTFNLSQPSLVENDTIRARRLSSIYIKMPIFVFFNVINKEEFYFDLLNYKVWNYNNGTLKEIDSLENYLISVLKIPQKQIYIINPDNSINWRNLQTLMLNTFKMIKKPYNKDELEPYRELLDKDLYNYLLFVSKEIYIGGDKYCISIKDIDELKFSECTSHYDDNFYDMILSIGYIDGNPEEHTFYIFLGNGKLKYTIWEYWNEGYYRIQEDFRDFLEFTVIPSILKLYSLSSSN